MWFVARTPSACNCPRPSMSCAPWRKSSAPTAMALSMPNASDLVCMPDVSLPGTESARKRATERTFSSKNLGHFCLKQAHILRKKPRRTTWVPTPLGAQVALFSPIFYFFLAGERKMAKEGGAGPAWLVSEVGRRAHIDEEETRKIDL